MANALVIRRYPFNARLGRNAIWHAGAPATRAAVVMQTLHFSLWVVWIDDFAGTMGFVMVTAERLQALRREGASLLCAPHLRREIR
jgi:hypothetical protein